ncbi:MFS transporter [Streptomyces sp. RGM 3693]|uniref:MFS transporter n=1 Tax=Streptomyces sp. RGM 3693 TaxID=3413284 RepID=UPI003D26A7FA
MASGAFLITVGGYYIVVTFMSTYAVDDLGFTDAQTAGAGTAASLVVIVCTPLAALAADRFGLRRITPIGILLHVVVAFPMFWLAETRSVPGLWLAMCLPMLASTIAYAAIGTLVSGWFAPRTRYTGLSMSFQTAGPGRHPGPGRHHLAVHRVRQFLDPGRPRVRRHGPAQRGLSGHPGTAKHPRRVRLTPSGTKNQRNGRKGRVGKEGSERERFNGFGRGRSAGYRLRATGPSGSRPAPVTSEVIAASARPRQDEDTPATRANRPRRTASTNRPTDPPAEGAPPP